MTTPQTHTTIAPNIKIELKVNSFLQLQHILNENMMLHNDENIYICSTTSLWNQLKQGFKLDRFWNPIRPPDQFGFSLTSQFQTAITFDPEGFSGPVSTRWKALEVYFQMDPASPPNSIRVDQKLQNNSRRFSSPSQSGPWAL